MNRFIPRVAAFAFLFLVGCVGKSDPTLATPDTGAKAKAEAFFGALIANDPSRAYATLEPNSKRRVSAAQFDSLARAYAKNVGFTAEKVYVHASDEQGDAATVHVTLTGHGHNHRYSDGITLRRVEGQWGIVLPANFAQKVR